MLNRYSHSNNTMQKTPQSHFSFKQGLVIGGFAGGLLGALFAYLLFANIQTSQNSNSHLSTSLFTHQASTKETDFTAENSPSENRIRTPEKSNTLNKNSNSKVSKRPPLKNIEASDKQILQQYLDSRSYDDLNNMARQIINQSNEKIAWQYLVKSAIQQGFYLNAIDVVAENISLTIEDHQRTEARIFALETLQAIDQLERSQGNTLQLIELYEHSLDILSPQLSDADSLLIALSRCYLAIGDKASAKHTLNNLQADTSPTAVSLRKEIEQAAFTLKRIPLKKFGKHYIATVYIGNSMPINLLLDTGASISTLNKNTFNTIENDMTFTSIQTIQVNTAGGIQSGELISAEQVKLTDINFDNLQFVVLDMPSEHFDGLLGMNILERFEFTIDQINHELVLSKPL